MVALYRFDDVDYFIFLMLAVVLAGLGFFFYKKTKAGSEETPKSEK